jgi:hypothetical protein
MYANGLQRCRPFLLSGTIHKVPTLSLIIESSTAGLSIRPSDQKTRRVLQAKQMNIAMPRNRGATRPSGRWHSAG